MPETTSPAEPPASAVPAQSASPAPPVSPAEPAAAHCANCGAPLVGPWCAQCGQKATHRIASLRRIIIETLEDQLQLDAALPRTISALFAHPGRLTREYIAGRIMRYIPPIRLYIASSVLFFLVFALMPESGVLKFNASSSPAPAGARRAPVGALRTETAPAPAVSEPSQGGGLTIDTVAAKALRQGAPGLPGPIAVLMKRLGTQIDRLKVMPADQRSRLMADRLAQTMPKVIFLMLPIFAALLELLYIRRHRLYVEHFVFALHVHSLAFLTFTPLLLLRRVPYVRAVVYLWLAFYLFHAMRVVYGQSRKRTALKFALLGFSYLIVVAVGMAAASLIAIMTL